MIRFSGHPVFCAGKFACAQSFQGFLPHPVVTLLLTRNHLFVDGCYQQGIHGVQVGSCYRWFHLRLFRHLPSLAGQWSFSLKQKGNVSVGFSAFSPLKRG